MGICMKVYILIENTVDAGDSVLGVYLDNLDAEAQAEHLRKEWRKENKTGYDCSTISYDVREFTAS